MDATRLVGVGASAGGVEALLELVDGLEPELPAALLVVLHQAPTGPMVLPDILDRRCALEVAAARDGDPLRAGPGAAWRRPTGTCRSTTGASGSPAAPGRAATARASTSCSARWPSRPGTGPRAWC